MKISKCFLLCIVSLFGLLNVTVAFADEVNESKPSIIITQIVEDEYISGKVSNLYDMQNYKVLVYVHTDKWYIHPYKGLDEGRSWAGIDNDGNWEISTVKREFPANKITAMIVAPSVAEEAPSPITSLDRIEKKAIIIYSRSDMKEKQWYGRL